MISGAIADIYVLGTLSLLAALWAPTSNLITGLMQGIAAVGDR